MLTEKPTPAMVARWKRIYEASRPTLTPNRRPGEAVDRYFREHYAHELCEDAAFREAAAWNLGEKSARRGREPGTAPQDIGYYRSGSALVAIDRQSGEFHMESENMAEVIPIHDDLVVYRGLDDEDLSNFFLVAEYVTLLEGRRSGENGGRSEI